jgi:hypothetical protein
MADQRAQEALQRLVAGEKLERREPKVRYNGAQGMPIREEILDRQRDVVITRNAYGARCLNTPNVLFADVDFPIPSGCSPYGWLLVAAIVAALVAKFALHSGALAVVLCLSILVVGSIIIGKLEKPGIPTDPKKNSDQVAHDRIRAFASSHPDWHLRVYRTPAGFRTLAMHRTFSPEEPAVMEFFSALGTDKVYAQMCRNQHCFRARVSPKPWRIGIDQHIRPDPTWPVPAEKLPSRQQWIDRYEAAALRYASCQFIESLGGDTTDPQAKFVQELHDNLSQAASNLPMG